MSICRHCGASIIWLAAPIGRLVPCEIGLLKVLTETAEKIQTPRGRVPVYEVRTGYLPHWLSCPQANEQQREWARAFGTAGGNSPRQGEGR